MCIYTNEKVPISAYADMFKGTGNQNRNREILSHKNTSEIRLKFTFLHSDAKCGVKRYGLFPILKAKVLCRKLDCIGRLVSFHIDF